MARMSEYSRTQFSGKNLALDEIAQLLNLKVQQLRARKMIVELLKFRGRLCDTQAVQTVLAEVKANKLERWSQFSPYLAGEAGWESM